MYLLFPIRPKPGGLAARGVARSVRTSLLLLMLMMAMPCAGVAQSLRYTQDANHNTTALSGLFYQSDCSAGIPISGVVVKREFGDDAISLKGFVLEKDGGTRQLINVDIPDGLSMAAKDIVFNGIQRLLRNGRSMVGTVSACGAAGRVLTLESVR